MNNRVFAASDICLSSKSNDIFLFVTMRLLSTRVNRNGDAVTEDFIDEIVANQDTYSGLPVYVDTESLLADKKLGHNYNRITHKFSTTQVGSLSGFTKVEDEYGFSLLAEARFPKREAEICEKILELYDAGSLNFSFEISYIPSAVVRKDGVLYIQANEHNVLTGLAIVSVPAYEEAVALSLVAEDESTQENVSDATEREGVETMNDENKATEAVAEEAVVTEETVVEDVATTEEVVAEEQTVVSEESPIVEEAHVESAEEPVVVAEDVTVPPPADGGATPEEIAEIEQLRATIAGYEAEIASLKAEKAELEAYAAAYKADLAARRANMARSFAEKQGLNLEDQAVADAIAALDFEKLAELALASESAATEVSLTSVASMNVETASNRDRLFDNDL